MEERSEGLVSRFGLEVRRRFSGADSVYLETEIAILFAKIATTFPNY